VRGSALPVLATPELALRRMDGGNAAVTFTDTLARDFPGAVPANQFVHGTQNSLKALGVHRGAALPLIATCRDELAFALTAELQRAWGPAFNMAGLAGLLTLGRTGVAAARGHAPLVDGRRTFVLFGLTHVGVDAAGTVGNCERPGVPGASHTCGALMALHDELTGGDVHTSDYPYLDPHDPEQSRLRERIAPRVADPRHTDLLAITRIAQELIDADSDSVIKVLRDDEVPADVAVFIGIHIHGPHGAEYVDLGRCFFDRDGEITELSL
jgi:Limiting CO2-inducible proteins B/C beta carbonyic anhydrases